MLYLGIVIGPIESWKILPRASTIILMTCMVVLEIVVSLSIRSIITKNQQKEPWLSTEQKIDHKEIPYVKKNFFFKWYLCGVENKVSKATRVIVVIKNIIFTVFQTLCAVHLIVGKIFTYGIAGISAIILAILQILAALPEYIRNKAD